MKSLIAVVLVVAMVLASAGVLLTAFDAQEWLPTVALAALAYLGTFAVYRRVRQRYPDREK